MAESYNDILKASIGKVLASAIIDNYFPLVGEMIKIDATTKWATASEWKTQDGSGQTVTSAGNLLHSKDSKTLQVIAKGELAQVFTGRNSLFSTDVKKTVYAMTAQALPYFDVRVSEEIIRTDGEVSKICIYPENGYAGAHTVVIRVYKAIPLPHLQTSRRLKAMSMRSFLCRSLPIAASMTWKRMSLIHLQVRCSANASTN